MLLSDIRGDCGSEVIRAGGWLWFWFPICGGSCGWLPTAGIMNPGGCEEDAEGVDACSSMVRMREPNEN